jgi:amino acid transporter
MTFIPAILFTFGGKGCQAISARLTMALGRDNGIPAPEAFQRVVGGEPIWGLTVAAIVAALMGEDPALAIPRLKLTSVI